MQWDHVVWIFSFLAWPSVHTLRSSSYGDICKQEGDTLWYCTRLHECPTARWTPVEDIRPNLCRSQGNVPKICCKPEEKSISNESKSQQKCKEYGEFVFVPRSVIGSERRVQKIDTCVAVEPFFIKGKEARPKEFPHMALIGFGHKTRIHWRCGGSLVSERFVLSAAHCSGGLRKPAKWVRLGEYNIESTQDNHLYADPKDFEIEERINHPLFDGIYNDIALYRLSEVVRFTPFMRPACLKTDYQFANTYAVATGWGATESDDSSDVLLKANLTLIPGKKCSDIYSPLLPRNRGIRDESHICAGAPGVDTCDGDSGGPLQIRLEEPYCMYSVIGVTSFGSKDCGDGSRPGVFTRVSHYVPWIESIVWP